MLEREDRYPRGQEARRCRDLLEYAAECKEVDYKSAVMFQEGTDFTAKLVKHVLGLANSGGGHLVIGYAEQRDRSLTPDPGLTDEIVASYDPTRFGQHVRRYLDGQDSLVTHIYKEDFGGVRYPVIRVYPFREYPFVCTREHARESRKGDSILRKGHVYVRTEEAKTVTLMTMDVNALPEWRQFIRECVTAFGRLRV